MYNLRRKNDLYKTTKAFTQAIAAKDTKKAETLLPAAYKAIDKAHKTGFIKANTAARKKSRLAAALKPVSA